MMTINNFCRLFKISRHRSEGFRAHLRRSGVVTMELDELVTEYASFGGLMSLIEKKDQPISAPTQRKREREKIPDGSLTDVTAGDEAEK